MQKHTLGQILPRTADSDQERKTTQTAVPPRVTNCIIYCRVSSKEQIEGTSLESQEIACKEYARAHGIEILKTFIERGESAKFADRTQLIELIDFCRTSKVKANALLVWKLDRFARNVSDHFNIKATLMKYGVRVVSVTEPIDGNPEGKLMETILAGFAQFDNDIRAARTVQGMRRKIQEGIFPWKPPLGYRSADRDGTKKTKPDEPNQPMFGLFRRAWREFATGMFSKADMLRLMHSWGIQTAKGISMTAQSLDNFYRNPYYAGILVDPWSGEQHLGKHIPMVSAEDFARVQSIIARKNRSLPHQKERLEFPLRSFARCATCRQCLTGGFSKGRSRRYAYYICGNRECDAQPNYRVDDVNDEFGAFLDQISPRPELIAALERRILQAAEKKQSDGKNRTVRKNEELARLEQQVQELIRMRAQHLITDREFIEQKAMVSGRQVVVASMETTERFDAKQIKADLEEVKCPLSRLRATWSEMPVGFQKRFNHMVLPVGFVIGESRTAELGPVFKVLGGFEGTNSHEVPLTGEKLNQLYQAIQAFAELFRSVEERKKAA
jgi:site-specific DNA recombinase